MADRETNVTNAYQSTLAAEVSAVAGTADLTDVTGLVAPFYLVIEPDDPAQREYVYVSALNGAQATLDERYLDGSAAASGLVHPAGSVVRHAFMAQHLVDINDRVDAKGNHDNLTGVSVNDHHDEDHAARHASGGADPLSHDTLADVSADDHHAELHAAQHQLDGADPLSWPAAFEMEDAVTAGPVTLTTSIADVASITFNIPATWASWKITAWATWKVFAGGEDHDARIRIAGVDQPYMRAIRPDIPAALVAHRSAGGITGSQSVSLRAEKLGAGVTDMASITLYARAVRTG